MITQMYTKAGVHRLLLCPPVGNARNIIDFLLLTRCYKVKRELGPRLGCSVNAVTGFLDSMVV